LNLFILILILFKLGSFPFQIWVVNVYSSTDYQVVSLLSTLNKLAIVLFSLNIIHLLKINFLVDYYILILPLISLMIGYFNLLNQSVILKFIAFSSIANSGWILFAFFVNNSTVSLEYSLLYIMNLILFYSLISSFNLENLKRKELNYLIELTNFQYINKGLALSFIISIFNFFALPPFSSFFPKLNVLFSLINYHYYFIAFMAILFSIFGTINYLKLIWILNNSTTEFNSNMILYFFSNKVIPIQYHISIVISIIIYFTITYWWIKNWFFILLYI
jgi:NADH-quinone oxidoreductase subunit N